MAFFFNRKKPELKEEMRMRLSAPSFSFKEGEILSLWTLKELKESSSLISDKIVILHPGVNMVMNVREWMKVLCNAYYLIVCYSEEDETYSLIKRECEKAVYSLVPKKLTGFSLVDNPALGENILEGVRKASLKKVVTINNSEGEL